MHTGINIGIFGNNTYLMIYRIPEVALGGIIYETQVLRTITPDYSRLLYAVVMCKGMTEVPYVTSVEGLLQN